MSHVVDALKLLREKKEEALRAICNIPVSVTKYGSGYGWNVQTDMDRQGEDLARSVEEYACKMLAAVRTYREVSQELSQEAAKPV